MLANSIRLAILTIFLAYADVTSSLSSSSFLKVLIPSLISFILFLNSGLWFLNLKNSSLIKFNS